MPGNSDLTSMLGAPELAAPAPAPVASPQAAPVADAAADLKAAILGQESGNNSNVNSSIQGAVGPGQIEPATFAAYARPGESITNPADNRAVSGRILDDYLGRYGDPARAAVAYFSGPGNVAPPGSPTPFLHDLSDGTGTRVSQYVASVQGRMGSPAGPQLASVLGLSPEEQKTLAPYEGPEATSAAAAQAGTGKHITFGPNFAPMSAAAEQTFEKIDQARGGIDPSLDQGDPRFPYYIPPGSVAPETAGAHWVDINGVEHVNPGGAGQNALAAVKGFGQGLGADTLASINRLTGGGFAGGDPTYAAFGQSQGGPSAYDMAQAATQGFQQQQRSYALAHHGDPYAQTGRFVGQAVPAIAASMAVPEVEAPAALGGAGKMLAGGATNALRGVAATAPSVGANPQPVAQQLATGALAGVVAPAVTGAVGKAAGAITGVGRQVSPEVATLADTARSKYGIPLGSGQVVGADGDVDARVAYSQALKTDPKVQAVNQQQRQQWQKGVTSTYGDPSGNISPDALSASRARIGGVMNDIASRSSIPPPVVDATQTRISQVIGDAQKVLPDNEVKPLLNMAEAIGDVRDPATGISGESYQALTRQGAPLDRLESSDNSNVAHYASQIHDALNDGLAASAAPEDVEALREARWQYKNLMTVAKAAQNQNNIGADGVLRPNALNTATTSNFKGRAFQGAGDLDELNAIRNKFMTEPSDSGTAGRLKDLVGTGVAGLATGGAVDMGLGLLHQPETSIPTALSALAGTGAKLAGDALKRNKIAGSAANIVARSLPNAPGPVSALSGLKGLSKSVEVPLSALAGVRGMGALQPVGAQ